MSWLVISSGAEEPFCLIIEVLSTCWLEHAEA
jgi:hypothetical protein